MHIYAYAYLCISMHLHPYLCISMHIYAYAYLCISMHRYAYLCICVHIYASLCISEHICAYTYHMVISYVVCFVVYLCRFYVFEKKNVFPCFSFAFPNSCVLIPKCFYRGMFWNDFAVTKNALQI